MWFCSECGKKNNGKYCTRCGTKHVEVDESVPGYMPKDNYGMMLDSEIFDEYVDYSEYDPEKMASAASLFRRENTDAEIPDFKNYVNISDCREETTEETEEIISEDDLSLREESMASESVVSDEDTFVLSEEENTSDFQEIENADDIQTEKEADLEIQTMSAAEESEPFLWNELFRHDRDALLEDENGSMEFFRKSGEKTAADGDENSVSEPSGIVGIFAHRKPPENNADREWKFSKRLLIAVGAVVGAVFLAVLILVGSLMINFSKNDNTLPISTGIYYYVSGVESSTPLYADKSIKSDVLTKLKNGDPVEFLDEVNSKFTFVYDEASEQYGYVMSAHLVENKSDVDDGTTENIYANEKSLGYYYVTKVDEYLTLWENPDGGGVVKAKLENGFKVSLLEKTNDKYWYVFDYNAAERGYVRCSYLTDDKNKVVGLYKEPKDKTVIGEYYVTGVKNYLPIYSKPKTSGDVRGKLNNGDKVGLIQKTNGSFWYVSGNGVYGWVSTKYLTATAPTPEPEPDPEPEQEQETTPAPAPDTSNDYKVTNTQEYLPVLSDPQVGGNEIGKLHNGDTVTFVKEYNDQFWYVKIPSLNIEGYVAKDYLIK